VARCREPTGLNLRSSESQRILTDLLEEIHELPDAVAAAIAAQQLE